MQIGKKSETDSAIQYRNIRQFEAILNNSSMVTSMSFIH